MTKQREKILKEFKKKYELLKKYNYYYYEKDAPKIDDGEYDKIKNELLNFEKKFPYVSKVGSVIKLVGHTPSKKFSKIKHLKPMLSLSNAFSKEDMEDFKEKIFLTECGQLI